MNKKKIMAKIKIPDRFEQQLDLGKKIFEYHKHLGSKSPLKSHFEMTYFDKHNREAKKQNDEKNKLEKLAENATELRDNAWKNNIKDIRSIAQFLKAINKDNPHELGKWGFVVDDSTKKK
jgi:Ni,Fe-hydrogenase I large subunit